jgi:hypothetical protein
MPARVLLTLACLLAALAWTGCGKDDRAQVSDLIGDMRKTQASGDAKHACEKVFVVQDPHQAAGGSEQGREEKAKEAGGGAEKEAGGPGCEASFEAAVAQRRRQLSSVSTRLVRVDLAGEQGKAVLHTTATRVDGSKIDRDDAYDVVHTEEGWRVRIAGEG